MNKSFVRRKYAGFTLLELLVVVAIIGFLSSVSIVALTASQKSSRDKQRKIDQLTIIKAAELYTTDFGAPPVQFCVGSGSCEPVSSRVRFFDESESSVKRAFLNSSYAALSAYMTDFGVPQTQFCPSGGCTSSFFQSLPSEGFANIFEIPSVLAASRTLYYDTPEECEQFFSNCSYQSGAGGGWYGSPPPAGTCGDGTRDITEDCDDGNTLNCDLCNEFCEWGSGTDCGDGITLCTEQCDDGAGNGVCPATCSSQCTINNCNVSPCGNGQINASEQCDDGAGNGVCPATCSTSCTSNTCVQPCGDGTCDSGENISSCPADCVAGGATPASCGDGTCDSGENPGNCGQDCQDLSMCYIGGQWNLCCLFGGEYCTGTGASQGAGYYGVCAGNSCQQRYLLQPPSYQCTSDSDCTPPLDNAEKFVPDRTTNWLIGLDRYMAQIPFDPGRHNFPNVADSAMYDKYYTSSHPDIVANHGLCVWISLERQDDNFNPYVDVLDHPTTHLDGANANLYWTVLCQK